MTLTYVELFAGAGGLSHGLDAAGWRCLGHAEIEPHARAVLRYRWPDTPLYGDVSALDGAQWRGVTLLSGGSPCQDLSVAGKRAGLKGSRSGLFHEQVRLWVESRAPLLLWENVGGALSSNAGKDFARIISTLVGEPVAVPRDGKRRRVRWSKAGTLQGSAGVRVAWRVIDLRGFAVPQRRRRVFVLAARPGSIDPAAVLLELAGNGGHRATGGQPRQAHPGTAGVGAGSRDGGAVGAVAVNVSDGAARLDPEMGALGTRSGGQEVGAQTRGVVLTFDARGNGDGATVNTLAGDHSNRVTDYTPLVQQAIGFHATQDPISGPDVPAIGANSGGNGVLQPIAFKVRGAVGAIGWDDRNQAAQSDAYHTLRADGIGGRVSDAVVTLGTAQDQFVSAPVEVPTLTAHPVAPGLNGQDALQFADAMLRAQGGPGAGPLPCHPRRLMPIECERLMSWPDGWTEHGLLTLEEVDYRLANVTQHEPLYRGAIVKLVKLRKRILRDGPQRYRLSDTARYRLCGNGCAAVITAWIGLRIADAIANTSQEAHRG
jgi:site-specific DNA-cytosine methylase